MKREMVDAGYGNLGNRGLITYISRHADRCAGIDLAWVVNGGDDW